MSSEIVVCEHGARCAGCAFLGAPYEAQLARKAERLERALRRHPSLSALPLEPSLGAERRTAYRRRVKWMVGEGGELGLYARDEDHRVVDLPGCRVVSPAVAEVGGVLRALLEDRGDRAAAALRAVDIRELEDEGSSLWVTLVIVRDGATRASLERFAAALVRRAPAVRSVFVNEVESAGAVQVLGPRTHVLVGEDRGWDRVAGVRVLAAPGAFVQAHDGMAEAIARRLRARARALVEGGVGAKRRLRIDDGRAPRVLDLFSGSGTWGLALAHEGADVVAIESFAPAAERIVAAAARAGLRVEARAGDAEREVASLVDAGERFDLVVVNPPRRGITPPLRAAIAALSPRAVAYVSCDPDTLARDLADFERLGYRAEEATPIDMIPLTEHVETLCFLAPAPPPAPRVLGELPSLLAVEKPAHEPPEALLERARARLAPPSASALVVPPREGSGVALFSTERDGAFVADGSAARVELLVGVKGVTRAGGALRRRGREPSRYERLAVASGHSLLRVSGPAAEALRVGEPLAAIRHPLLGDRRVDPRTRRHFTDRYGLDRAFLHVERIETAGVVFECPLSPDLSLVAERLGWPERSLSTR
jgi:23S rRNA (uracil1939-C5)-methyltransferase